MNIFKKFGLFSLILIIACSAVILKSNKSLALDTHGLTMRSSAGVVFNDTYTRQFLNYTYLIASPQQDFTLQRNGSGTHLDLDSLTITCNGVLTPATYINQRNNENLTAKLQATDYYTYTMYLDDTVQINTTACAGTQQVHLNVHEHDDVGSASMISPYTQSSIAYVNNSNPVIDMTADGNISTVDGTTPLFSEFWTPTSGHPSGTTYIYISDDANNYYITADVTTDNTDELRGEDFWRVTTRAGETFLIDDFHDQYGVCGFSTTSKVSYPHATCEMKIPKAAISSGMLDFTMRYLGTVSGTVNRQDMPQIIAKSDNTTDSMVMPGQTVTYTILVDSGSSPTPGFITSIDSTFTDTLDPSLINPTNLTYSAGCQPSNPSTSGFTGSTLTIYGIDIFEAASCIITYDATVGPTVLAGTKIDNTVTAQYGDSTLTASSPTLTVGIVHVFDPPSAFKTVDASNLPVMTWKMVWINDGNASALNTQVLDPIPTGTTYQAGSLVCTPTGASVTTACVYDAAENRVRWEGNIAPAPGGTDEANSNNEVVITFSTTVPDTLNSVTNQAKAYYDENGNGTFADDKTAGQTAILSDNPTSSVLGDATAWQRSSANLENTGQNTQLLAFLSLTILSLSVFLSSRSVRWYRVRRT